VDPKKIEMTFLDWVYISVRYISTTMSPFIIKKRSNNKRKFGGGKPTYKKTRDDDDVPVLRSDSESDTDNSSVSSSDASSASATNNKRRKTAAANMVVGKIAEALASSVIAAAIAKGKGKGKGGKKNIISIIGRARKLRREEEEETDDDEDDEENEDSDEDSEGEADEDNDSDDEDSDDEDSDEDDSDEDDSDSDSDDDEDDEDDDDEDDDESDGDSEAEIARHKKQQKKMEQQCEKNKKKLEDVKETIQSLSETMAASSTLANNKFMKKQLADMKQKQRDIEYTLRADEKKRDKLNVSEFRTLLRKKNSTNDLRYFRRHMTSAEQQKVIADLKEIHAVSIIEKPYRLSLLETNIPIAFKAIAMRKINSLRHMEPGCGEYYKVKNWVDTFMKIPFNKMKNLPLTIDDGLARCSEFMEASKTTLDTAVYGLNDAKLQIMQMVGQWISNPSAMGSAIAIKGPMGTGKTSLVKEGISKILGRDFAFIALGGATDSSFLEGHSYTYEGSTWGKIVEIIIQCGSINPVIYFDELDKISDTAKGEEIVGILTHLTDTSQNTQFHDRYFAEIDFDLSKCLFIFSYNDESKVNPILLDRMYRINTTGYNKKDKTQIAQKYLIPKICEEVGFRQGDIVIPDSVIEHIVENYTEKEEGVRNLKRCLEVVHRKLNLYRLIKPDTPLFEKEMSLKVAFPFSVTSEVVDKLVKQANDDKRANLSLYL
jgi:ATP-dependent Lon protease